MLRARKIGYAALVAIVGCSSHDGARPAPQDPTTFFTPAVTGVLRGSAQEFPLIDYVSNMMPAPLACWTKLRAAIDVGYQLEVPGNGSYFVFVGAVPRDEVERCLPGALGDAFPLRIDHDGELLVVDGGRLGTVYAAWRGSVIIAGSKAKVTSALAANAPDVARTWRDRLAAMPNALLAMWRSDALFTNLFGVPTTSYVMLFDRMEKTPRPFFAGRVIAQYATAGDAATAVTRNKNGGRAAELAAPPELVESIKRLHVTQTGATVTCEFSVDTFAGVDLAMMQKWIGGIASQRAAVAAGSASAPTAPTASTCDQLRPSLTRFHRKEVDYYDDTKTRTEDAKQAGVASTVDAAVAVCDHDRWDAPTIACFARGLDLGDGSADRCISAAELERIGRAEEAAFNAAFGPPPPVALPRP